MTTPSALPPPPSRVLFSDVPHFFRNGACQRRKATARQGDVRTRRGYCVRFTEVNHLSSSLSASQAHEFIAAFGAPLGRRVPYAATAPFILPLRDPAVLYLEFVVSKCPQHLGFYLSNRLCTRIPSVCLSYLLMWKRRLTPPTSLSSLPKLLPPSP